MGVNRDAAAVRDGSVGYDLQAAQPAVPVGYKQTEVGVIPEDWYALSIGEFSSIKTGPFGTLLKASEYSRAEGVPLISVGEIGFGKFRVTEHTPLVSKVVTRRLPQYVLKKGDIVFGRKGAVERSALVTKYEDGWFLGSDGIAVRPQKNYEPAYLAYQFQRHEVQQWLLQNATGTTMASLNQAVLSRVQIPHAPIHEQRAIATALSDVDALLEGLDRLIAKKRDLKQAAMQQLLTGQTRLPGFEGEWRVKQLDDLAHIVMGQSPNSSNYNLSGDGLPLIQGNADIDGRKTIKRVFTTQITKHGRAGDILMSVRAPVGEISRATFEVCLGRGVCALRSTNEFLYHYLIYLEPSWAKHSKGSTFDSVNSADIKTVEVWLPSDPDEQSAIASILSDMDAELEALEQRRAKTAALKQAMMQELLTGRTRLV